MAFGRRNPYGGYGGGYGRAPRRRGNFKAGLIIALFMAGVALFKYFSNAQYNEVTGEKQYIAMTVDQEIQLGLESAPRMAQQHGGLYPNQEYQDYVDAVGNKLLQHSAAQRTKYKYNFHLLADPRVVNAFALPGGQIFITYALFSRLQNEDQLAGVLGHEIGHVVARHSAERLAKQQLTQGLTGAAVMASGDYGTAQMAQLIGNAINMKYGREQELQSDELGVRFMSKAGYDPYQLIGVMKILEAASGGAKRPEFNSTHPSPENRIQRIKDAIKKWHNSNDRLKIN